MKIAIISNGFTGATLPLSKHLNNICEEVKCFYIVKVGTSCMESLNFDKKITLSLRPKLLKKSNHIYNYLSNNVEIHLLSVLRRRPRIEKYLLGNAIVRINREIIKKQIKKVLTYQIDYAIIIVHTELEVEICKSLQGHGIPFCIVFHEVLFSHSDSAFIKKEVVDALQFGTNIIIHSEKTEKDLLRYSPFQIDKEKLHLIHFGQFESYSSYGEGIPMNIGKDYFLYLGYIFPHKGLKYLYEAVISCRNLQDFRFVIAGQGKDPVLVEMQKCKQFVVINRFIENAELVNLILNCRAIVCPYISGSQSGLVQTGMYFKKPVVATRVAAFEEIIEEGKNGFLAEPSDASSLSAALLSAAKNTLNVTNHTSVSYDWNTIARQYIELAKSAMS